MSDDAKNCAPDCGQTLAFFVLRGWLAVRAIVTGLEKYAYTETMDQPLVGKDGKPDPSGVVMEGGATLKHYMWSKYHGIPASLAKKFEAEPLLPHFMMSAFEKLLGPLLILSGFALLIGLGTRISLFVQGIIYIMLTVGLILIGQNDGIAFLGIHVGLVAMALTLSNYNRLCVCKKF